ncbi:heavy-metal-associated domain-containing protein [Labrys portucalensis]|uniref:Heavy-metal-associated domain-containing protein n=1 Tax=Labrys neptuniae TaxID=376174 RepID=A0ABV6Z9Y5_9HYPH|nr:heavy-metal-associated domain-containing protein [Labrys neptuniae]MDT3379149.1 heavy-metal-associated domain-containing protein [Labrys neptuniae]
MITLKVPEMSCGHCVKTITGALQAIDPGAAVEIDLGTQTVKVASVADEAKLRAAIAEAGYESEKLPA